MHYKQQWTMKMSATSSSLLVYLLLHEYIGGHASCVLAVANAYQLDDINGTETPCFRVRVGGTRPVIPVQFKDTRDETTSSPQSTTLI